MSSKGKQHRLKRACLPATTVRPGSTTEPMLRRFSVPLDGEFKQESLTIDLTAWSRPRLAEAFAAAMRSDLLAPGTMCTTEMVTARMRELFRFWRFLNETNEPVDSIEGITAELIDRYEAWLIAQLGNTINCRHVLARPIALLRRIELDKPGTLAADVIDRLGYLTHHPFEKSRPRDAYSPTISAAIRRAARDQVLDAASRIIPEGQVPAVPDGLHESVRVRYERLLAAIDRQGVVEARDPVFSAVYQTMRKYHPDRKGPYSRRFTAAFI